MLGAGSQVLFSQPPELSRLQLLVTEAHGGDLLLLQTPFGLQSGIPDPCAGGAAKKEAARAAAACSFWPLRVRGSSSLAAGSREWTDSSELPGSVAATVLPCLAEHCCCLPREGRKGRFREGCKVLAIPGLALGSSWFCLRNTGAVCQLRSLGAWMPSASGAAFLLGPCRGSTLPGGQGNTGVCSVRLPGLRQGQEGRAGGGAGAPASPAPCPHRERPHRGGKSLWCTFPDG